MADRIFSFNSGEGAGKSEAVKIANEYLTSLGFKVKVFAGLGSGTIGEEIRKRYLTETLEPIEASLFKLAAITDVISQAEKYVQQDTTLNIALIDRDYYSHYVYDAKYFNNEYSTDILKIMFPKHRKIVDVSVFIDTEPCNCIERLNMFRKENSLSFFDKKGIYEHTKIYNYFKDVYEDNPYSKKVATLTNNYSLESFATRIKDFLLYETRLH